MPDSLWTDFVNPNTGEHSLKEHQLRTVWTSCKQDEHFFELTDSPKRECTCKKCGFSTTFVLGISILKDGKIIPLQTSL